MSDKFEEFKAALLEKNGLQDCVKPITYGGGDLREAFQAGEAINGELTDLCDQYFSHKGARHQPYAGANYECTYCGAGYNREGQAHHSAADCPVVKYAAIAEQALTDKPDKLKVAVDGINRILKQSRTEDVTMINHALALGIDTSQYNGYGYLTQQLVELLTAIRSES